ARSESHSAISALGRPASTDRVNDQNMSDGSWRKPSLQARHIEGSAGGILSASGKAAPFRSGEDVIRHAFLVLGRREPLRLEVEHSAIASAEANQFGMAAELDNLAVLEHTNAVSVAHRREAMRDQDGRTLPRHG